MNALVVVAVVCGAFVLGFGLGRESLQVRRRFGNGERSVSRPTPPPARPVLRVITGGRVRRSGHG